MQVLQTLMFMEIFAKVSVFVSVWDSTNTSQTLKCFTRLLLVSLFYFSLWSSVNVQGGLENLEKYLNFEKRFQGHEKTLKIEEIKKILEKTLNFGVTTLTFVESKILVSRIEAVYRKSEKLAKSWDRSTIPARDPSTKLGRRDRRESRRDVWAGLSRSKTPNVNRATFEPASWPCAGYRRLRTDGEMTRRA